MSFGERLKHYRKLKGLNQEYVASALGKKKNTISNWEHGIAKPDVETLSGLCRLLEVNPNYLFEEFDNEGEVLNDTEQKLISSFRLIKLW